MTSKGRPHRLTFLILAVSLCSGDFLLAQSSTATLSGTVVDQTDAVVPGVEVTLDNKAIVGAAANPHERGGIFAFPSLLTGEYKLAARHDGFAPVELERIVINVNDQRVIRFSLPRAASVRQSRWREPRLSSTRRRRRHGGRSDVRREPAPQREHLSDRDCVVAGRRLYPSQRGHSRSVQPQRPASEHQLFHSGRGRRQFWPSTRTEHVRGRGGGVPSFSVQGGTSGLASVDAVQKFTSPRLLSWRCWRASAPWRSS